MFNVDVVVFPAFKTICVEMRLSRQIMCFCERNERHIADNLSNNQTRKIMRVLLASESRHLLHSEFVRANDQTEDHFNCLNVVHRGDA